MWLHMNCTIDLKSNICTHSQLACEYSLAKVTREQGFELQTCANMFQLLNQRAKKLGLRHRNNVNIPVSVYTCDCVSRVKLALTLIHHSLKHTVTVSPNLVKGQTIDAVVA